MNENERNFFLKRFFSFNVSHNVPTGSNNASFDESNDELVNLNTQQTACGEEQNQDASANSVGENCDPSESATIESNKQKSLAKINEKLDEFEHEKKFKEKKYNYETVSRRNKFKKSTDSTKFLLSTSSYGTDLPDYNLNESCKSEVPQICVDMNKTEPIINSMMSLKVEKPGKLQEQYSIELKPFKKKEVQIDVDSANNNYKTFDPSGSPLLSLSLNSNEAKILAENSDDNNQSKKYVLTILPTIEGLTTTLASNKIKFRLVYL